MTSEKTSRFNAPPHVYHLRGMVSISPFSTEALTNTVGPHTVPPPVPVLDDNDELNTFPGE
jgi:hypothetical protein